MHFVERKESARKMQSPVSSKFYGSFFGDQLKVQTEFQKAFQKYAWKGSIPRKFKYNWSLTNCQQLSGAGSDN